MTMIKKNNRTQSYKVNNLIDSASKLHRQDEKEVVSLSAKSRNSSKSESKLYPVDVTNTESLQSTLPLVQ